MLASIIIIVLSTAMAIFYYPSVFYSSGLRVHSFTKQFTERSLKIMRLVNRIISLSIVVCMIIILIVFRNDMEKANTINAFLFLGQFFTFGLVVLSIVYIIAGIRKRKNIGY